MFSSVLSAITGSERHAPVVDTREKNITAGGHQIHIATVPIASTSSFFMSKAIPPSTSLAKRVVTNNACLCGCTVSCVDGLSTSPDPPLAEDCTALVAAPKALAQSEIACVNLRTGCFLKGQQGH